MHCLTNIKNGAYGVIPVCNPCFCKVEYGQPVKKENVGSKETGDWTMEVAVEEN